MSLRAGYYYDPSPSPVETLNILLPGITYNAVTIGLGYKTDKVTFDFCVEYLMGKKQDSPMTGKMPGTHGMNILVPNIAITYHFN
jgi:long-chain fatty acid transport protein